MTLDDGRRVVYEVRGGAASEEVRHGSWRVLRAGSDAGSRDWLVSGEYEGGVRDGSWRYRYDSGELAASGKYRAGQRKGRWKFLWPNGSTAATGVFKDGEPTGKWEFSNPLDPTGDKRSMSIEALHGESPGAGCTYSGYLADGEPIGWWRLTRSDGSLLFEGAFDPFGGLRAKSFRHAGGLPDPVFFAELRDTVHPHDFLFRPLDELSLTAGEPLPAPLDVAGSVASLAGLWPKDAEFAEATPTKLVPMPAGARVISYAPGAVARTFDLRSPSHVRLGIARGIKALAALDWSDAKAVQSGLAVVQEVLAPGLGYPELDFAFTGSGPQPERNGLAILRAHSLLTILRHDADFWLIDAALETTAPGEGLRTAPITSLDPRQWLSAADAKAPREKTKKEPAKRRGKARSRKKGRDGEASEIAQAVESGLQWLTGAQQADGSWAAGTLRTDGRPGSERHVEGLGHDVGVTALAVLALARDPLTKGNEERMTALRKGLRFILGKRKPKRGLMYNDFEVEGDKGQILQGISYGWVYDHAVAIQALAESRHLVQSHRVDLGLEDGIRVLYGGKNPYGGWRYAFPANGDSDVSVVFWVMRALLAAESAGYPMEESTKEHILQLINEMTDDDSGRTGYVERGSPSARVPGGNIAKYPNNLCETLTAEAVALRQWLGESNDEAVQKSAELMLRSLPHWTEDGTSADYCYWLAGTEAMGLLGGAHERAWNAALLPVLLEAQRAGADGHGSWDPIGPWGYVGGRTYATASAILALQLLKP